MQRTAQPNGCQMNDDQQITVLAIALANQALLVKLIAALRADNTLSAATLREVLDRAYAVLEEDHDTVSLRARVLLESLEKNFGLE